MSGKEREKEDSRGVRLVLVDDQDFIRAGLRGILSLLSEIEIVGEARTGQEGLDLCRRLRPDLVLMDIEMPEMDGLTATRKIKEELPTTSVLVLTAHDDPDYLLQAVQAGAAGYILKEHAFQRVPGAIRRIVNGESPLDQELAMRLLARVSDASARPEKDDSALEKDRKRTIESLTERERGVLELIALGRTNQEIARELFISVGTVKTHVHRIISKLGVSDRTQAAVLAIRMGLAPAEG